MRRPQIDVTTCGWQAGWRRQGRPEAVTGSHKLDKGRRGRPWKPPIRSQYPRRVQLGSEWFANASAVMLNRKLHVK